MIIKEAELYHLKIPFKLNFSHAKADRFFSDSIILRLTGNSGTGYGEAVIREYVSGNTDGELTAEFNNLLEPFRTDELSADRVISILENTDPDPSRLPLLCAVETAVLDLLCNAEKTDIYGLLGYAPIRNEIIYGGTLPLLPEQAAEKLLKGYKQLGITNLRIKINRDPEYNNGILSLARRIMGETFDIKVDANAGWTLDAAERNLPLLREWGVKIIEEPFGREEISSGTQQLGNLIDSGLAEGMVFMADESALTAADILQAAEQKTFGMVNIRLAKNGGILKALKLAETAAKYGIRYMSGCHVGETGILSAAGRAAASIMKQPEYVDGSFDSHLLSGNITVDDLSFGEGGKAGIIRNSGIGFKIDQNKLEGFTCERNRCF